MHGKFHSNVALIRTSMCYIQFLSCKALPCWQCIYHVVNLIFLFQIHNFQSIFEASIGSKEDERNVFAALQVRKMS